MKKILFVCTGNICRSPTAEAILRHKIEKAALTGQFTVDSAGVQGFHSGQAPDSRAIQVAAQHGVAMNDLSARKVTPQDFGEFDLILAMDDSHLHQLNHAQPEHTTALTTLFLEYAGITDAPEVADPYYGTIKDFEDMFNLIDAGADAMLKRLTS